MVDHSCAPTLSGHRRPATAFRFLEPPRFDPAVVGRVLRGESVGCIFRNAIDQATCRRVAGNFWAHPHLRRRGDDVPAFVLGTFHYRKPLEQYLDEAAACAPTIHAVFAGGRHLFQDVIDSIASALAPDGVTVRPAGHLGRSACEFVVRSWAGAGGFSLEPHEDGAQLTDPLQAGFEIQRVAAGPVLAVNLCLENPAGGELHYWNIEPDAAARARFALQWTGYPYPLAVLEGLEKLVVPIGAGDIYFFNGKHVHAVAAPAAGSGYRSTISCLMGLLDSRTLIYWS